MQVPEISSERRARLLADSLLAINSRNEEILHGLTHEESQFLIDFDDSTPSDATTSSGAARLRSGTNRRG